LYVYGYKKIRNRGITFILSQIPGSTPVQQPPRRDKACDPKFPSSINMAKRRKNRTHLKDGGGQAAAGSGNAPKSFIIKHGQVGHSLTQLVRDMRKVMEPNTAARLKVRIFLLWFCGAGY